MKRALLTTAAAAVLAAPALAAPAGSIDLLHTFRAQIPRVRAKTSVPILLPRTLPLIDGIPKLYPTGFATRRSWALDLGAAPGCGGANACFVASFQGERGEPLPRAANARLAGGDPASYHPISCGGSCAPASFWFVHAGVLYSWQVKEPPRNAKAVLVRLANEAIAAGAR